MLKQVRGKAVAKSMRGYALFDASHAAGVPADLLNRAGLDMGSGLRTGEQLVLGPLYLPVPAQQIEQGLTEHGVTVFGSFALYYFDAHVFRVYVSYF